MGKTAGNQEMKKAIFYDPYLDTLGGGERYVFTLVEDLLAKDWQVDVLWPDSEIKEKLISRLKLDLGKMNCLSMPAGTLARYRLLQNYDLSFWLSDGSLPLLSAKENILHFQVPFHHLHSKNLPNRIKSWKINHFVCNSAFTKSFVDREFGIKSEVIYPPVDLDSFQPGKKEKIILSVGRFSQLLQAKRQDVLIESFKKMVNDGLTGWRLVVAGATDVGGQEFYRRLKSEAATFPIEVLENLDFQTLRQLYARARIFWYAAGYEIDETQHPERVEHFGITTVEAMAAGCVPLVVGKGGLREIIEPGQTGFFWQTQPELINLTLKLIKDPQELEKVSGRVRELSQRFSKKQFVDAYSRLITHG